MTKKSFSCGITDTTRWLAWSPLSRLRYSTHSDTRRIIQNLIKICQIWRSWILSFTVRPFLVKFQWVYCSLLWVDLYLRIGLIIQLQISKVSFNKIFSVFSSYENTIQIFHQISGLSPPGYLQYFTTGYRKSWWNIPGRKNPKFNNLILFENINMESF